MPTKCQGFWFVGLGEEINISAHVSFAYIIMAF